MIEVRHNGQDIRVQAGIGNERFAQTVDVLLLARLVENCGFDIDDSEHSGIQVVIEGDVLKGYVRPVLLLGDTLALVWASTLAEESGEEVRYYFFAAIQDESRMWHLPDGGNVVCLTTTEDDGTEEFHRLPASEQLRMLGH